MSSVIPRILVVDENRDLYAMVQSAFADENFHLFFAEDDKAAMGTIRLEKPDVVLYHVQQPGRRDIEFCQSIKLLDNGSHIIVIILSGSALEKDLANGFKCGADDVLIKPFSVGNLKARVKAWLMRKGDGDY
jgi:DNA-binding response OmpR family regulator